jgi:hypothetical protein
MVLIMDGLRMRAGADIPHPSLTRLPAPSPLNLAPELGEQQILLPPDVLLIVILRGGFPPA